MQNRIERERAFERQKTMCDVDSVVTAEHVFRCTFCGSSLRPVEVYSADVRGVEYSQRASTKFTLTAMCQKEDTL